ncbi:MAG: hypothetical protein HY270_19095 [Deltaproteobacteria bacterium]|nr:hypothetical protein [Deltaproteobacteria bacterium]
MDRPGIHDIPRAQVLDRLRQLAVQVEEISALERYDFLLNSRIRVTLRTAFPSSYRRTAKLRKREHHYVYRAWNFNFHHRGRIDERYTDFFICVPLGGGAIDLDHAYIIPWEVRSGKTFYLPDSQRPYRGKYSRFRGAWELLTQQGIPAPGPEPPASASGSACGTTRWQGRR